MDRARILLVDDHVLFRSGIKTLLEGSGMEVVGEAASGADAIRLAEAEMPDLILMDINMPGMNGLEATRKIKEQMPYVKIVMLTASEEDDQLFEAVRAGAQGYLIKHLEPAAFLDEVGAHLRGEASISGDIAMKIIRVMSASASHPEQRSALTAREEEVLKLVGEGASNREIAHRLFISENTVKNHLRNILQKLHFENRVQAAAYAIRHGLVDRS